MSADPGQSPSGKFRWPLGIVLLLAGVVLIVALYLRATNRSEANWPEVFQRESMTTTAEWAVGKLTDAYGKPLTTPVPVEAVSNKLAQKKMREEVLFQFAEQGVSGSKAEKKEFATNYASEVISNFLAFYSTSDRAIYVLPDNFIRFSEEKKEARMLDRKYVESIVLHEYVHAFDAQLFDLVEFKGKCLLHPEGEIIFRALLEGHAELRTKRTLKGEGYEEVLGLQEEFMLNLYPLSEALLREQMQLFYVQAELFLDSIEKEGGRGGFEMAMDEPPSSTEQIRDSGLYLRSRNGR